MITGITPAFTPNGGFESISFRASIDTGALSLYLVLNDCVPQPSHSEIVASGGAWNFSDR